MDDELIRLTKEHELKAAETGHWVDCIKAHGLANACAVLDPTEENLRAVYNIEQTWYGGSHPLTFTQHQALTNKHKQLLQDYRVETKKDFDSLKVEVDDLQIDSILSVERLPRVEEFSKSVFEASRKCCDSLVQISEEIIKSSLEVVNNYSGSDTPCSFAAIGLGSIARGEATPYSDLEYAFLVESKEHADYFEKLAVESYFRVGNVGESYLKGFDINQLSQENKMVPSPGFRIDGITPNSGNIPTGNGKSQNLTLTVDELIGVYLDSMNSPVKELAPLSDLLSSSVLIYSNAGGQRLYDDCVNRIHTILINNKPNQMLIDKRIDMITVDVEKYRFLPEFTSFGPPNNSDIKIKTDIFRYPTLLANHVRLALALESCYAWDTYSRLKELNIISDADCSYLNLVLALSIYTRTHACVSLSSPSDQITLYTSSVDTASTLYYMPQNVFIIIGCLLVPIKSVIHSNLEKCPSNENFTISSEHLIQCLFSSLQVAEPNNLHKVEVLFFAGNHDAALECLYSVVGKDCLLRGPQELLDLVSSHQSVKSDKHFIELCCYLLCSARNYGTAISYFNWLITIETFDLQIIQWKILTADCLNKMGNHIDANNLINDVIQSLRTGLGLVGNQSLPYSVLDQLKPGISATEKDLAYCKATAHAYKIVGETYKYLKIYVQAKQVVELTLRLFQSLLSRNVVVEYSESNTLDTLGTISLDMGDFVASQNYFDQSLVKVNTIYGAHRNHPDIAEWCSSYANLQLKKGQYGMALHYYTRALDITKSLHTQCSSHVDIAVGYSNIGNVYYEMGKYTGSIEYSSKSLDMAKVLLGDNIHNVHIVNANKCIGNAYCKLENYATALKYLNTALDINIQGHPSQASLLSDIGNVHSQMGDQSEALRFNEEALNIITGVYDEVNVEPALVGNLYQKMGEFSKSLSDYNKALNTEHFEHGEGSKHPSIAESYNNIGLVYDSMGEHSDALKYLTLSLDMKKAVYGEGSKQPSIATTSNNIGWVYYRMGEYSEALKYYTLSLDMMKAVYGESSKHPSIAEVRNNISICEGEKARDRQCTIL